MSSGLSYVIVSKMFITIKHTPCGGEVEYHDCHYDDADEAMVKKYKWWIVKSKNRLVLYAQTKIDGTMTCMNRYLEGLEKGDPREVDHLDGDGLNNRRSNLKVGTKSDNLRNCRLRSDNKSGHNGVYKETRYSLYVDGRQHKRVKEQDLIDMKEQTGSTNEIRCQTSWRFQYRNDSGVRHALSFKSEAEALTKKSEIDALYNNMNGIRR